MNIQLKDGTFIIPLHFQYNDKRQTLTANWYRNAHWATLNAAKKAFTKKIHLLIKDYKLDCEQIILEYRIHIHRGDIMNYIAIIDKFFCDAIQDVYRTVKKKKFLTQKGLIPDDDYSYVKGYDIKFIEKVKKDPYVEIKIKKFEE